MYGIDFGTSNTVVTLGGEVLDLGEGGVVPSLLYFERDRRASIGAAAVEDYGAALARWSRAGNLDCHFRFFQALKLALKDELFLGTRIFGEFWPMESLVALFLREVKRRADEAARQSGAAYAEAALSQLVVGRPVTLSPDPNADRRLQERFRSACLQAGFGPVDFVLEPVAAAVSMLGTKSELVLVFDFGGGTLDITVAKMSESRVSILASAGRDLGGYLLNEDLSRERIIRHFGAQGRFRTMTGRELEMPRWITDQVCSFYALPLADLAKTRAVVKDLVYDARSGDKPKLRGLLEFLDRNLAFSLFREIDAAKIALSTVEESSIDFGVPPHLRFSELVRREDFEALIEPRVRAARDLVLEALGRAGVESGQIDRVVRVGGSSRVPVFVAMLESIFPGRVEEGEVFTSIARGLVEARERGLQV